MGTTKPSSTRLVPSTNRVNVHATHTGPRELRLKSHAHAATGTEQGVESRANAHAARTASREQRLRAHPHADVRGPESVVCRLCGGHIKLSTKSAYDAFHWNKHIERCARRAPAAREQRVIRTAERKQRSKLAKEADHQPEKRAALTIRLRAKGAVEPISTSEPAPAPAVVPAPVHVKEETPETAIDTPSPSTPHSGSSPSLDTPSPPATVPLRQEPDAVMEDYYRRSRRRGTRELSPFTLEAAAAWSWSQVKEPVWVVRSYSSSEFHDSESSPSPKNTETNGRARMLEVINGWPCAPFVARGNEHPIEPTVRK